MRLLLDTHVFLWFITGDSRLSSTLAATIRDPGNEVYLSTVSVWECIVKHQLGKLPLPEAPDSYLHKQRERHLIMTLPFDERSAAELAKLPRLHADPFDRMLICQATCHGMVLATVDPAIRAYPLATL